MTYFYILAILNYRLVICIIHALVILSVFVVRVDADLLDSLHI